jgi:purine-binding chemotaxis protein CheW
MHMIMPKVDDSDRLTQVYRQRAARLAARKPIAVAQATTPVLVFELHPELYAIDLASVMQVMPLENCTPVPGAPPSLAGIINVRGEIRSVVDLASLLDLPKRETPEEYVMLVRHDEHAIGFKVDGLKAIERIAMESLCSANHDKGHSFASYVQGVTPDGVTVLDVAQLFSHPIFTYESITREQESSC